MAIYDRGGEVLKTGRVGRVNILRQQFVHPGEEIDSKVRGMVRMSSVREHRATHIHAHMEAYLTPIRWLWDDWTDYLTEGPETTKEPPVVTFGRATNGGRLSDLGLGSDNSGVEKTIHKWWERAPLRVYNEYWKWPEDDDVDRWGLDGLKAVNLPNYYTRLQGYGMLTQDDWQFSQTAASKIDIRALSKFASEYRTKVTREWKVNGRYQALMRELWNARGSREVDKVPFSVGKTDGLMAGNTQEATDGDSLGQVVSGNEFRVNHDFGRITPPEHCILTYVLCVRFPPISEGEWNPQCATAGQKWEEIAGDAGMLANSPPDAIQRRDLTYASTNQTAVGYLPAGWRWRARWSCIGHRIDERNSFPLLRVLDDPAATATKLRDATEIGNPFRTASLGDYTVDLHFDELSDSIIPGPDSSLYAGL